MTVEQSKRLAARAALSELPETGLIGLGSGSTSRIFIEELGLLARSGRSIVAVATSNESRTLAERFGITVLGDEGPWDIAVTVDGADEVDTSLNLIKGGGAAHAREKIVNHASRKNVIIVDETKISRRLGEKCPVPVEVLTFGHRSTARALGQIGRAALRVRGSDPVFTDACNFVYDLFVGPMDNPADVDRAIRSIPGVVETGLFIARADVVIVGESAIIRIMRRPRETRS
jgi:ribose 5-phosphate isomerase A